MNSVQEAKLTDKEKVIEKLQAIDAYFRESFNAMDGTLACEMFREWSVAAEQAIALLKEQEPRVVKMSELTAGEPMLVWLEDIDKEETVAGMIFDYVPGRLGFKLTDIVSRDRIYPRIEDYLTRWRCWTSRPDKATREATPWNV